MNRIEFGKFLKDRRREKGLTLQEMAQIARVSFNYLSSLERGGIEHPAYDRLKLIARGYHIPEDDIVSIYYPSNDDLDRKDEINKAFESILADPAITTVPEFAGMLAERKGDETKLFIIRLYEKLAKKKVLNF